MSEMIYAIRLQHNSDQPQSVDIMRGNRRVQRHIVPAASGDDVSLFEGITHAVFKEPGHTLIGYQPGYELVLLHERSEIRARTTPAVSVTFYYRFLPSA